MKKILIALLLIGVVAVIVFFYGRSGRDSDMSGLFDEKPSEVTSGDTLQGNSAQSINVQASGSNTANENISVSGESGSANGTNTENGDSASDNTDVSADMPSESTKGTDSGSGEGEKQSQSGKESNADNTKQAFSHSEAEKQAIIGRYIEAENFYYSMLYQHYELDSYDVIVRRNPEGYNTEYHRVLYYGVNSRAELKNYYREYFTDELVSSLDLSAYIEENGKLYCAETENASSSGTAAFAYSVESIDENNVIITKSPENGSGAQRIKAVKSAGKWYFASVAIK